MQAARLGDVCAKIGSGATPRGGESVYRDTGVALIRSQNVYNHGFEIDGLARIGPQAAADLDGVTVESGDVLLNITGDSVARCCQVPEAVLPARVNQHVSIVRPRRGEFDARFLRYYLICPAMQEHMLSLAAGGATRNALTKGMIEDFVVPRPPLDVQRAIGSVLGVLDDKIDLNRRMNRTLEETASALFRSWFLDFDPVVAKAAGRAPFDMDATPTALFPSAFEESELGPVPRGWRVTPIDDVAEFLNGLPLQRYPPNGGVSLPVIKISQLRAGTPEGADRANTSVPHEYVIDDGDLIFSWSGSLLVDLWCGGRGALNQHLFKVTSTTCPKWFCLLWLRHHLPEFQGIAADKATTMGHIRRHHLTEALVLVPPDELLRAMDVVLAPLLELRVRNAVESRTLAALRDTLLPRLLSGEIRLRDAERLAEAPHR